MIPLGFALGSTGDAFKAKRRKNPWVRIPLGYKKRKRSQILLFLVIPLGFEPKTHSLEGCCSNPTELRNHHKSCAKVGIFMCTTKFSDKNISFFYLLLQAEMLRIRRYAQKKEVLLRLPCGAYGTRTRDLLRDRQAF